MTAFMLPMNLCFQRGLAGRARLCSRQLSCGLASSERCSLMSLGVDLDCWLKQPTYCFHVSCSSSQYGGRIPRTSVPRESQADSVLRFTDQAPEVMWHRWFFLPSPCPGSHKGLPRFTGRRNRLYLLMGPGGRFGKGMWG